MDSPLHPLDGDSPLTFDLMYTSSLYKLFLIKFRWLSFELLFYFGKTIPIV